MSKKLAWTEEAWKDYSYWQTQDKKTIKRINKLVADVKRHHFKGIGKPEPLKENLCVTQKVTMKLPKKSS